MNHVEMLVSLAMMTPIAAMIYFVLEANVLNHVGMRVSIAVITTIAAMIYFVLEANVLNHVGMRVSIAVITTIAVGVTYVGWARVHIFKKHQDIGVFFLRGAARVIVILVYVSKVCIFNLCESHMGTAAIPLTILWGFRL